MRILGIDLGVRNLGFAALEQDGVGAPAVVDVGVCCASPDGKLGEQLDEIYQDLRRLMAAHKPHAVVSEAPSFVRNARVTGMLYWVDGAIRGLCEGRALLVRRTGREWRGLLGLPHAKDGTVRKATTEALVRARFPGITRLLPDSAALHVHAYDATAIACTWADRGVHNQAPQGAQPEA